MNEMDEGLKKNLIEWSEGNEYLYSLLYLSWQHGIRTGACCGGHIDRKNNNPYIMFIVDENSLPYIESMIGALEDVPDISISFNFRNDEMIPTDSRKAINFYCMMHNRMSVFYKLADAIINKHSLKTSKGRIFYERLVTFLHRDNDDIKANNNTGIIVGSTFTTHTNEYMDYILKKRNLLHRLKQALKQTKEYSKYDTNEETLDESPQVRY